MQLHVGDRFTDESGEWEITTHPTAMSGGKYVHARARRRDDLMAPACDLNWPAHQRIEVVRLPEGLPATSPPPKAPRKRSSKG